MQGGIQPIHPLMDATRHRTPSVHRRSSALSNPCYSVQDGVCLPLVPYVIGPSLGIMPIHLVPPGPGNRLHSTDVNVDSWHATPVADRDCLAQVCPDGESQHARPATDAMQAKVMEATAVSSWTTPRLVRWQPMPYRNTVPTDAPSWPFTVSYHPALHGIVTTQFRVSP